MPEFDQDHVKLCNGIVVYDGITRPDKAADKISDKWTLKVAFDPNNPDIALYEQLANAVLQNSKFRGQLPQGGRMPIGTAQAHEFNGLLTGRRIISFKTLRFPDIYSSAGVILSPVQFGPLLFPGQIVDVLGHCYEYDKAGNQGITGGLDGFSIMGDQNTPRQDYGASGIDTSSAFSQGGQPAQQYQQQQPAQQAAGAAGPGGPNAGGPGGPTQSTNYLPNPDQRFHAEGAIYTRQQLLTAGYDETAITAMQPA